MHKLASIALLYCALAFVFILILGVVSYSEPIIIDYLVSGTPSLSFLSAAEASHMADVRALVANGMHAAVWCVLFLALYSQWKPVTKLLMHHSIVMSLVLVVLVIPFNYTFTKFHTLFFPHGNWQFPPESYLITHFSQGFFFAAAIAWIGITVLLLILVGRVLPEKKN